MEKTSGSTGGSCKIIPKELITLISLAQEKLALTRRELQEVVVFTSLNRMERFRTALAGLEAVKNRMFGIKLTTQLGLILTSKKDHIFISFGIIIPFSLMN